jgi:peptidoglycan/xylan/chitin deacetylase (PgdA/CDA1 family)
LRFIVPYRFVGNILRWIADKAHPYCTHHVIPLSNSLLFPCAPLTLQAVALTFDDGPDLDGATEGVLDILASERINATFFINTNRRTVDVRRSHQAQHIIRRIVEEGHTLASHTATHARGTPPDQGLAAFSDDRIKQELLEVEEVVQGILGPSAKPLTVSDVIATARLVRLRMCGCFCSSPLW